MFKTVFILVGYFSCIYGDYCNEDLLQVPPPCDLCEEDGLEEEVTRIASNCFRELWLTHDQCRREMRPEPYQYMYLPKIIMESRSLLIKILKPYSPWENLFFRCYMALDNTLLQHCPSSDESEYFSNGWYSGTFAFFDSLKKSIDDVYTFSKTKLQESIEESSRRINTYRTSSTEIHYANLYSPDEKQCLCGQNTLTCLNCLIKDDKNNIQQAMKNMELRQKELPIYMDCINHKEDEARVFYKRIYDNCIQNHDYAWSYYERGLLYFEQGDFEKSLDDVLQLLNAYEDEELLDQLPPKVCFSKGITESELGLYRDAIQSLSYVIEKDPDHKEAHFERAVAYFEEGAFDLALQDYLTSGFRPQPVLVSSINLFPYSLGLTKGLLKGGGHGAIEFIPSLLSSVHGLGHGLWVFVKDPVNVSIDFVKATRDCVIFIKDHTSKETLVKLVPELGELIEKWDKLEDSEKGEITGYIIGKYGVDIFAGVGVAKGMKLYRNLKKANNMLTFEALASSHNTQQVLEEAGKRWALREEVLRNGKLKINWNKQNKHVSSKMNPTNTRSILTHPNPQMLVDDFAGTGQKINKKTPGTPDYRERIDFKETIGIWKSVDGKIAKETTVGMVIYAKDGVHIVPLRPLGLKID